jgi:inner membrane protein
VDLITQAALGAGMGELIMGKRLGKRALAWGALFGVMPEFIESLFFPLLDTARELACSRALGHSLAVMVLGSWGLAHGLERLWRSEKVRRAEAGWFVFAVWAAHVAVDCCSTEGAEVLWPFPGKRLAFGFLPEVDFLFSVPLVAAVLWLACRREVKPVKTRGKKIAPPPQRRNLLSIGVALSASYAAVALGMKFVTSAGFDADLARRGTKFQRRIESPTPFNILLWRSVVDRGGEMWVGYRSVFESRDTPVRWTVYLKNPQLLQPVAAMRETKTLMTRADGWWLARPYAKGAWLGDLRFPESRVWGSKKGMVDSLLGDAWVIDPTLKKDHLRSFSANSAHSSDYFQRLATRISGNRESWEANPRLAGVSGSLPEFLAVEE